MSTITNTPSGPVEAGFDFRGNQPSTGGNSSVVASTSFDGNQSVPNTTVDTQTKALAQGTGNN